MPSAAEHLAKYQLNRAFLNSNGGLAGGDRMWASIVAFYSALHLVERLATRQNLHHMPPDAHGQRSRYLARHAQHRVIYADYRRLREASELARYGTVNQFQVAYPGNAVQDVLIDQYLVAIEKYVAKVLGTPAA